MLSVLPDVSVFLLQRLDVAPFMLSYLLLFSSRPYSLHAAGYSNASLKIEFLTQYALFCCAYLCTIRVLHKHLNGSQCIYTSG